MVYGLEFLLSYVGAEATQKGRFCSEFAYFTRIFSIGGLLFFGSPGTWPGKLSPPPLEWNWAPGFQILIARRNRNEPATKKTAFFN